MSVRRSRRAGKFDRQNIQPVIEIFAKAFFLDHVEQVAVGRGDDADIDVDLTDAADAADLFFLQGTQDFCLQRNVKFADLVQKQRAVVGDLKQAFFVRNGSGERAFFVAEQLGFEQVFVDRGTVYGLKYLARTQAVGVDRPRDQLFAGAAFAADEDGRIGLGDLDDQLFDLVHLGRDRDDLGVERRQFFKCPRDGFEQLFAVVRLLQILERPQTQGIHRRIDRAVGREQNDDDRFVEIGELLEQIEPAHAGHLEIGQHEIKMPVRDKLHRRLAGRSGRHVVAFARQNSF